MTKQELASKVWAMANKMRTKIKANEYKDYILGFMFYKFLSDREVDFLKDQGITQEELQELGADDLAFIRDSLGYAISYPNLFSSWRGMGIHLNAKVVSEGLDDFNRNVNPAQKMVFEHIFDTLQNGISKMGDSSGSRDKAVRDIVDMINTIPSNKDSGYDVLGYIYEFLIYKFSTAAKDDGAFYTPHEVSKLIAMIVAANCKDKKELRVYDPTSGSGSLLRTIGEEAERYIDKKNIMYYGQEKITETYHLTRMNLIMKGIPAQNIVVRNGDTLEDDWPYFDENTAYKPLRVNAVCANPPYSVSWDPFSRSMDDRFRKYGLAPAGKADYAFLLHCLYHLEEDGTMAIVLPHGVLFRGDAEGEIRKNLCLEHNIETIIGLPDRLFFSTGIPTVILILRKSRQADDILFIDASKNFEKGKNQNFLRDCDIKRIFDAVMERKDVPNFARLVPFEQVKAENFNLNIPRYVSAAAEAETFELAALVNGTVPNAELDKFDTQWSVFPALRQMMFEDLHNGYSAFTDAEITNLFESDPTAVSVKQAFEKDVDDFMTLMQGTLLAVPDGTAIADVKDKLSAALFEMVDKYPVLDRYAAYQRFINAWKTIETDLSAMGGSLDLCRRTEPNMVLKKAGKEEVEIQQGYKGAIIPFDLVGKRYFEIEYDAVEALRCKIAGLEAECDELFGCLDEDVKAQVGDGEKFKDSDLKRYLKDHENEDLSRALECMTEIRILNKKVKDYEVVILDEIKEKIESLTREEIRDCLCSKWIKPLGDDLNAMLPEVAGEFLKSLRALKKKYGSPLSKINEEIAETSRELGGMLDQLVGSDIDMQAIAILKRNLLGE